MDRINELRRIYEEMDEEGKKEMTSLIMGQKVQLSKSMSEQEINMWSILISVLKNQNKKYERIDEILPDICEIKELIKDLL